MELPSLSVILPNYNHARYLPAALRAILGQSVPPLEVIVMDDASTDNSLAVIREFAEKHPSIRVIQNAQNQGVIYNMNRGLALARGDYVTFPAADDEVVPGLFEKSLRLLAAHPRAALSCAVSEWRYAASGLVVHAGLGIADRPAYLSPDEMVRVARRQRLLIVTSSTLIRRAALEEVGGFLPELRWHCDWFAVYTTAFRHGICYLPEVLSLANILPQSYYQSGHRRAEHREVLRHLMARLTSPAFADVQARIRDSGELSLFALPMLRVLLGRPEYRAFINRTLLRKTLRRTAELAGKKILPPWLARWCLDRFYRFHPKPPP